MRLLPDEFSNGISAFHAKHFAIATHLAAPFRRDHRDLQGAFNSIALEGFELQRFAAANDVAAIEVATHAMGFKQGSAIGGGMDWRWSYPEPKHQQQANKPLHLLQPRSEVGVSLLL